MICKYFVVFCGLFFHFLGAVICSTGFSCDGVYFITFVVHAFGIVSKNHCLIQGYEGLYVYKACMFSSERFFFIVCF